MTRPPYRRAFVVGLGLLGGSLALALKKRRLARTVVATGRDRRGLEAARKAGVIDAWTPGLEGSRTADLVALCTPFSAFETILGALAQEADPGCLVVDVGSVKGPLARRWARAARGLRFVPSHPMAGGALPGWRQAKADLFEGAACLVTPVAGTPPKDTAEAVRLWKALGMRVARMDPARHDRVMARVSHLPHLVAFALAAAEAKRGAAEDFAWAGKGWFDTTRVAASDPDLWAEVLCHQGARNAAAARAVGAELARLGRLLASGDRAGVRAWIAGASRFRRSTEGVRA